MFKPQRIDDLISSNRLTKKSFCKDIAMSVQGLDNVLKGADIGSSKLERIADYFKVPIDYFFDRNIEIADNHIGHQVNGTGNKVSGDISLSECQKEIKHLQELIVEKEKYIKLQEETIKLLTKK